MTKRKGLVTLTPFEEKEWPDWSLSVARTEAQTVEKKRRRYSGEPRNTEGRSITVQLTSCLTGLESAV
jgi:hypothetical protein